MGKKARTKRSEERKKLKRFKKSQKSALYQSYREAGKNQKSKRNKLSNRRSLQIRTKRHASGRCYNHGCTRCTGVLHRIPGTEFRG